MSCPKSLPTVLLGLALACPALAETHAVELAPAQVLGQEPVGEGQGVEEAAARLAQVPGGSNWVDMRQPLQGRVASNQDVLAYQPGVYAQSAGNEGVKISIRGSGINRAPGAHASGLYTMLDGLPLTGPGGTPYELLEPLWVDHVQVLRGANGFDRGALAWAGPSITSAIPATTRRCCRCATPPAATVTSNVRSAPGKCWGISTITSR